MAAHSPQQEALLARKLCSFKVGHSRNEPAEIFYKITPSTNVNATKGKIVLIMGLNGRADSWEHQVDFFSKSHDVLVFDNRGCGQSTITQSRYTTKMLAQDLAELLNHLQWQDCHIIGTSMGGMIAQELTLIEHARIRSLSLLATHAGGFRGLPTFHQVYTMVKNLIISDPGEKQKNAMNLLFGSKTHSDPKKYSNLYAKALTRTEKYGSAPFRGYLGQVAAVLTHYVSYARLDQIKASNIPVMVVTGSDDIMIRPSNSIIIAKHLGVEPIILDGAGHHLAWEDPELINGLISSHIEKVMKSN